MVADDLAHVATADVGPLHCILYRDASGTHLVALYTRGPGSWSARWRGMLVVDGLTAQTVAKALAWAREVRGG